MVELHKIVLHDMDRRFGMILNVIKQEHSSVRDLLQVLYSLLFTVQHVEYP